MLFYLKGINSVGSMQRDLFCGRGTCKFFVGLENSRKDLLFFEVSTSELVYLISLDVVNRYHWTIISRECPFKINVLVMEPQIWEQEFHEVLLVRQAVIYLHKSPCRIPP